MTAKAAVVPQLRPAEDLLDAVCEQSRLWFSGVGGTVVLTATPTGLA